MAGYLLHLCFLTASYTTLKVQRFWKPTNPGLSTCVLGDRSLFPHLYNGNEAVMSIRIGLKLDEIIHVKNPLALRLDLWSSLNKCPLYTTEETGLWKVSNLPESVLGAWSSALGQSGSSLRSLNTTY